MGRVILHLLTKVFIVGATYNKGLFSTELRTQDHQTNLETLFATDKGIIQALGDHAVENLEEQTTAVPAGIICR